VKAVVSQPETEVLYRALNQFRQTCLVELRSAFLAPDDPAATGVWTVGSATELVHRFVEAPDESKRKFIEKLQDQLADATAQSVQLLVELTWLHVVVSHPQTYQSKRQLLNGFYSDQVRPLWQPDHDATKPAADTAVAADAQDTPHHVSAAIGAHTRSPTPQRTATGHARGQRATDVIADDCGAGLGSGCAQVFSQDLP
jgi:hypothetical protein